ncbi:MAG: biopolymer transport protein ExbD [Saprospiraceae bacterium]
MNFRKNNRSDDPELNFIPLIDVLLVIIIFLAVSTTFDNFSELKINLAVAEAKSVEPKDTPINVVISEDGRYAVNDQVMLGNSIQDLADKLINLSKNNSQTTLVIISADAKTPHQFVVNVMEASRKAGLTEITFSTKIN